MDWIIRRRFVLNTDIYKLKRMVYKVLKNQKAERMNEIIQYLNENYIKILRKY